MANALNVMGQRTAAAERFEQVLSINPDDPIARHFVAALHGRTPSAADPRYARAVFDSYAANFEEHLTGTLSYDLPSRIPDLLEKLDGENAWYSRALDLGCGTGLVGAQIRSYCDYLAGVDVSEPMLRKAMEKAVYDKLLRGDVVAALKAEEEPYDIVLCADVLVYLGDLAPLFQAIGETTAPGGTVLISTELLPEGDFALRTSGRYAHSDAYIAHCAEAAGMRLRHQEHVPLRKEQGDWLTGGLYVLVAN
jgi:predicted TPR repeat methyltransferase